MAKTQTEFITAESVKFARKHGYRYAGHGWFIYVGINLSTDPKTGEIFSKKNGKNVTISPVK